MADGSELPSASRALAGRRQPMAVAGKHAVNGRTTVEPFPEGMEMVMFGTGCFWGAERRLWRVPGVFSTQVGYSGGITPNPNYQEVCSGLTGHAEVVRVVYSPQDVTFEKLLKVFWESHDPTQGLPHAPCCYSGPHQCSCLPTPPLFRLPNPVCGRATTAAPSTARSSTPTPPSSSRWPSGPSRPSSRSCATRAMAS
ncbi:mitochondrial peptide methionine sulfoxide reductase isoform X2 [Scleropages formosus]|uniref:mitochondrial peptide methionine sulfoxide reductase isoform X2 n=1 Tax=Scleropages formosus TaxID=113540 RepID=UPI0010FA6E02|nr:mitochondrial peptide methionine sulfoxide reductase-like isoform X2 [Scleropages formosus]